jgi:dTDP-glucose 4,6-dehydratase
LLSLVTGGAGFIGSHIVDALIAQGDTVVIADNLSTGSLSNLENALRGARATFAYIDVARSFREIRGPIREAARRGKIGRIFHFASPAGSGAYVVDPRRMLRSDALSTTSVIDIALEHGARFIYASTSEIAGDEFRHPQPESYFISADPLAPHACYEESKRFGEAAVAAAVAHRGLDGCVVRFFNCYGPRMSKADGRLIATLARAAEAGKPLPIRGDGHQMRSMIFVSDAIRMLMILARAPRVVLDPVDIGGDEERTVLEIAEAFARNAGIPFEVEHLAPCAEESQRRLPDLTLARSMGFTARTTLNEGLARTVAWLRREVAAYA